MQAEKLSTRRLILLSFVILIWYGLITTAFSFSINHILSGAVKLAIALVLIAVMVEGRLVRLLEGRPTPTAGFIVFLLLVAVLVYDGIRGLFFNEITVLGSIYLPGVISLVRGIGSFVLAGALLWEIVRLMRQ